MLKYIFPWLRLKEPNLTWYKRFFIYSEIVMAIVLASWILWLTVGLKLAFSHEYTFGNLHFLTTSKLTEQEKLNQIMKEVEATLSKADIDLASLRANIFLEKDDLYYKLSLVPGMQLIKFGSAITIGKYIFLPNANIEKNIFRHQSGLGEDLNLTLVHELIHVWQNQRYTTWTKASFLTKNAWYMEGYPVYITNDPIMHDQKIVKDALANAKHLKRSQKEAYALWGLMVKHAIEKMHKSVDDLHLGKVDYAEVLDSLLREYNITKGAK